MPKFNLIPTPGTSRIMLQRLQQSTIRNMHYQHHHHHHHQSTPNTSPDKSTHTPGPDVPAKTTFSAPAYKFVRKPLSTLPIRLVYVRSLIRCVVFTHPLNLSISHESIYIRPRSSPTTLATPAEIRDKHSGYIRENPNILPLTVCVRRCQVFRGRSRGVVGNLSFDSAVDCRRGRN